MAEAQLQILQRGIDDIKQEVLNIKKILLSQEQELTPWARRELKKSREQPRTEYVSLHDL